MIPNALPKAYKFIICIIADHVLTNAKQNPTANITNPI